MSKYLVLFSNFFSITLSVSSFSKRSYNYFSFLDELRDGEVPEGAGAVHQAGAPRHPRPPPPRLRHRQLMDQGTDHIGYRSFAVINLIFNDSYMTGLLFDAKI